MSYFTPQTQPENTAAQFAYNIKQHRLIQDKKVVLQNLESNYEDGLLNDQQVSAELIATIEEAVDYEKQTRKSMQLDKRPSFVATQLENLLARLKKNLAHFLRPVVDLSKAETMAFDERLIYVYLFNVQGQSLRSWRSLLSPAVFKGSSVHHPVFISESQVKNLIRTKRDPSQHGFVTVKIKKSDVISEDVSDGLVRLKYGALETGNIVSFVTLENTYTLEKDGSLKSA